MFHRRALRFLILTSLLATAACGHKAGPETPAPELPPAPSAPPKVTISSPTSTPLSDSSAEEMTAAARRQAVLAEPIYFGYDRADLTPVARQVLDAKAALLREVPGVTLSIGGHADERGSDEHNLALGMRRATAAKRYLVDRGLPGGRFETVSFGEEQPALEGHDEAAWVRNRRAEFGVSGREGVAAR